MSHGDGAMSQGAPKRKLGVLALAVFVFCVGSLAVFSVSFARAPGARLADAGAGAGAGAAASRDVDGSVALAHRPAAAGMEASTLAPLGASQGARTSLVRLGQHLGHPHHQQHQQQHQQQVESVAPGSRRLKSFTASFRDEAKRYCYEHDASAMLLHWSCDLLNLDGSGKPSMDRKFVFPLTPASSSPEEKIFSESFTKLCKDPKLGPIINISLTCQFLPNYLRHYDDNHWMDEAFLTYVRAEPSSMKYFHMAETLITSVHLMSKRPVLLICIDTVDICERLNVTQYPNLIVMHMTRTALSKYRYLDYYKWLGMAVARIRTGIELDADQIVLHNVDDMFERVRVHTNAAYPYPIMPVHWMSRDPQGGDYEVYWFREDLSFPRAMRWGHAHPTWTFHALPFLATMYERTMLGVGLKTHWADEDIANVLSWELKLTKQWCKFDNFIGELHNFLQQSPNSYGPNHMADKKWYPEGVPIFFTTLHNAKDPVQAMSLARLAASKGPQKYLYYWKGKWMHREELEKMNPPCVV